MLNDFRTPRVAVLCSKQAPGLDELLHHPNCGRLFELGCVVTTGPETDPGIEASNVPVIKHPVRPFHHGCTRRDFDTMTATILRQLDIDTVLLLGYLYVLSDAMLTEFPKRILNIHDADLTIARPDGERKYVGLHATRDAILAGEKETRSSVHYVTDKVDAGPIVLMSERYPVATFAHAAAAAGHRDIVNAYAFAHREWMMRDSWGSLAARALEFIAAGVEQEELATA